MAVPTTITGKHYKCEDCKQVLHRPLICQFHFHNKPVSENRDIKHLGNPSTTLSFGPFYSKSLAADRKWEARKEQFWKHVLRSSEEPETTRLYVKAIKRVESEARALYEKDDLINHLSRDDFISMMIKDGCFMLQVAIYVLGRWKLLGYPDDIFGEQGDRDEIDRVILVLFVLGNQIPLIILKDLMKQSFFQKVLHSGKWNRPMDLPQRALYDFLIVPAMTGRATDEPSDILHGFWLLLAGPRCSTQDAGENDDSDESSSNNEFLVVPNATKLQLSGISFEDNGGMGTRGIRFNRTWFGASISLPSILINSRTEVVLRNLIRYEFVQQMGPNGREACAYLQLMCELIRTPDDAKLLADRGIIYCRPTLEEELPEIFDRLYLPDVKYNRNIRLVRNQIRSYRNSHCVKSLKCNRNVRLLPDVKCNRNVRLACNQIRNYRRCNGHRVTWEMVPMVASAILLLVLVVLQILTLILKFHQNPEPGTSSVSDVGVPLGVVKDALVLQRPEL